jgi:cytochrome c-type biogenesis protein CcmH/NrfG
MLFDLSSTRRRRTTVKIIYGLLAVLMVVGLVLLGVGTGSGGLLDSGNNTGGTGSAADNGTASAQIKTAQKQLKANPTSATAFANLEQAYLADAQSSSNYNDTSNEYTKAGHGDLEKVIDTWNQYAKVQTRTPNENAVILAAYAMDITGDFKPAVVVWQDFIGLEPSAVKGYECLAATSYATKNTTLGLQALNKAIALTPKLTRLTTKTQLNELKTAADAKEFATDDCQ